MSVTTQNNILDVFVAKDIATANIATWTNLTAAGYLDPSNDGLGTLINLADGQVGVVGYSASGKAEMLMDNTPTVAKYPYIRFVMRNGSDYYFGSKIYGKDVYAVTTKAYTAPAEQVYYVGYNGSSGSLDVSQSNEFIFTIAYDHDDMMWSEQKLRNSYDYYSPAPTQQNLAMSMASQINYKENLGAINGTGKMVIADMLAQGTSTALDGSATLAVINGSTTITASAAQTTNWAIGTVIRIGTGATATTDPVYVITGVTSTTVATINMPYQGTTNSAVATANIRTLSGITNWGFRITGQPLTWRKDFFKFNKVKFHFDIKGFGATTYDKIGVLTAASSKESTKGVGYYQETSEWESFAAGNQGALNRMVVPLPAGRTVTDSNFAAASTNVGYNMWVIESRDTTNSSPIVATTPMRIQTVLFFLDTTNGDIQQSNSAKGLAGASAYNLQNWFTSAGFTLTAV